MTATTDMWGQRLLKEADVAALLQCTPHQVRRLPITGRYLYPNSKRGKRYYADAVHAFISQPAKRESKKWLSTKERAPHTTGTNSRLVAKSFAAALSALPPAKQKRTKKESVIA